MGDGEAAVSNTQGASSLRVEAPSEGVGQAMPYSPAGILSAYGRALLVPEEPWSKAPPMTVDGGVPRTGYRMQGGLPAIRRHPAARAACRGCMGAARRTEGRC